jgi:hypothetical protein
MASGTEPLESPMGHGVQVASAMMLRAEFPVQRKSTL